MFHDSFAQFSRLRGVLTLVVVTVTSRVVALALGLAPIGVIKRASRLDD